MQDATALSETIDSLLARSIESYGKYVLEDRAIPALEDGLKPVQRRILWAAHKLGLKPTGPFVKSAKIVGNTIAEFHPHGDAAVYSAMVRMAEGIPCKLIDGYGNFGNHAFGAAAARYTEARLSSEAQNIYFDPFYLRAMETIPNFDSSSQEPVTIPCKIPMVLAIGHSGIAVGTTTEIPAFTTDSLIAAVKFVVGKQKAGKSVSAVKLAKLLKFASRYGGYVSSPESETVLLLETGVAQIEWTCDYTYKNGEFHITGLPPCWNYESRFAKLKNHPQVAECYEKSNAEGILIHVKLKKLAGTELDKAVGDVKKILTANANYKINICSRSKNTDNQDLPTAETEFSSLGILDLLEEWVKWRLAIEKKALKAEMAILKDKLSHEKLLLLAIDSIDVIFDLLKAKKVDKVAELSRQLKITTEQSQKIWNMSVGRLDNLSRTETLSRIKDIKASMATVTEDLADVASSFLSRNYP